MNGEYEAQRGSVSPKMINILRRTGITHTRMMVNIIQERVSNTADTQMTKVTMVHLVATIPWHLVTMYMHQETITSLKMKRKRLEGMWTLRRQGDSKSTPARTILCLSNAMVIR